MSTIEKMNYLNKMIDKWRIQNNNSTIINEAEKITNTLLELIIEANNWKYEEREKEIKNIESYITMIFLNADSISNFLSVKIGVTDRIIMIYFFKKNNSVEELLKFNKNFSEKLGTQNRILDIYWTIKMNFEISVLAEKPINLNNINSKIKDISEFIDGINNIAKWQKGRMILILLYIIAGHHDWKIIKSIVKNNSTIFSKIRWYFKKLPRSNQESFSYLSRLFEWFYLLTMWKDNKPIKELSHYTTIESLDAILQSGKIKFSKLKILNDGDENLLLNSEAAKNIYTFSLTKKSDSLDLFGNYTNMDGISIVFSTSKFLNRLNGLTTSENEDFISMVLFDVNEIYYDNNPQIVVDKIAKEIQEFGKSFLPSWAIKEGITGAKKYLNYFLKKEPWEYEDEFRIAINIPDKNLENKIISGKKKDDAIFLNFDLKEDQMIEKIIIGPNIKKSKFKQKILRNILKEYNLTSVPVIDTEANYIK